MKRASRAYTASRWRPILHALLVVLFLVAPRPAAATYEHDWDDQRNFYWQQMDFMIESLSTLEKGLNYLDPLFDDETFGYLKDAYDFTDALRKDIKTYGDQGFSPERSHTFEQSAKYVLGKMPDLLAYLQKTGKLSESFKLPATFGAEDFAVGIGRHIGTGKADIETITYYLDALNKACWGILGYMVGGPEGARVYQALGGTAAKLLREATLPLFEKGVLAWRGQGKQLVDDWRRLQERRLYDGLLAQRISDVYGYQLLRDNGLSDREIQELDAAAGNISRSVIDMKQDLSIEKIEEFTESGELEVGGVSIDPQLIRLGTGGEELKEEVLDSRPSEDELSWPVNLPNQEEEP